MQSSYYLSIKRYYIIMHKQGYVCVCVCIHDFLPISLNRD